MTRVAYVNGAYVPHALASVHIEDRGYQFADAIYEVCLVVGGRYWDLADHLARMRRSLNAIEIDFTMTDAALKAVLREILRRNRLSDALVYFQISRGVAARNHPFPDSPVPPSLIVTTRRFNLNDSDQLAETGMRVISQPDTRWGRVDIKTVGLLPNVLAKQAAKRAGAGEAWLLREDDRVTEGCSSNAWIVTDDGSLITHPKTNEILGGVTRETVLACARDLQIPIQETPFTVKDVKGAREAFVSSATGLVMPVVKIDAATIGDGAPGSVTLKLREAYKKRAIQGA